MNKKLILSLLSVALLVTGCGQKGDPSQLSIITPSGAPSMAFYKEALSGQAETNTNAAIVKAELQANKYDAVVFDFYNGLRTLKNNNGQYKLAKMITGGNIYLLGINKTESTKDIQEDSRVVSFNENSIPDLAFQKIYQDTAFYLDHVPNNIDLKNVILTGKYDQEPIDYVCVAEPLLNQLLPSVTYNYTVVNLREKWFEKFKSKAYILQAGLFINTNTYKEKKNDCDALFNSVSSNINDLINNPSIVKNELDKYNEATQKSLFSMNSDTMYNIQKDKNNGFGYVESVSKSDIDQFLKDLGKYEDFSDFIL